MKTALITGVSGGMGRAAAERLIRDGWTVCGLDLREPEDYGSFRFFRTDLTDPEAVGEAARTMEREGIRFDAVVHMAGVYELNSLLEMEDEDWRRVFEVNLYAAYRVNRAFLPLLSENARILLTASELAPLCPLPFTGIYAVTKAALEKYALALRMEMQLLGHRVIVLEPGAVDTGLLDVSTEKLERFCRTTKLYPHGAERMRTIVDRVEARKIPPERIADLVSRILAAKRPRGVYRLNRNPLLLMLNLLPVSVQCALIRRILRD
ncbi:MAG: SDR family NAD(P)-dependent oxidoreductase [Ruminococcaceae bacterium]|jgi:NAD(P)-dependent dehydrogenase (short-subunit alcohol dehydrogenase family)|nr:SDR family NAD(P)-dependent oxidoreductase [Oscillospiraceae bacterium]